MPSKPPAKKSRILIVDDHALVRKGLSYVIDREPDLEVCGECEEGARVSALVADLKPDVVILDISLKDINGIDLLKDIKKLHPGVSVLVLSMHEESLYAERVLRAGGMGYISKDDMLEKVVVAVREVLQGNVYAADAIKNKLLKSISRPSPHFADGIFDRLSDRELEVFQLLGQGYSTRRIAELWHRSIKTVETYRSHIKSKLQFANSTELVHAAVQWVTTRKQG